MQCATHPDVETELGCSRCGKAICPRCLVNTPVGARCRECANVRRVPTYNTPAATLAMGTIAALVAGVILGVFWWFFLAFSFGFFSLLIGAGIGWAVAQSVLWATNRRAGPPLQAIAAAGVGVAYLVRLGLIFAAWGAHVEIVRFDAFGIIALAIGVFVAIQMLR
jgi:hypothetical protein